MLRDRGTPRSPGAFGLAELVVLLFLAVPLYVALSSAVGLVLRIVTTNPNLTIVHTAAMLLVPLIVLMVAFSLILASRHVAARRILAVSSLLGVQGLIADPGYLTYLPLGIAAMLATVIVLGFNVRGLLPAPRGDD
jgi:hypothetical protein